MITLLRRPIAVRLRVGAPAGLDALLWRIWPPALIAALTWSWFRPGAFIGSGDVSPFIRNGAIAERGAFWNHSVTGAGGTSADAGRALETYLIDVVRWFGGDELLAQRILFAGTMAIACAGVSHLMRRYADARLAVAVAGLVGALNPLVLLQLPNLIFPLAIGTLGLLLGEVIAVTRDHERSTLRLVLATIPVAYLSINPPLVAVIALSVAITAAGSAWRNHTARASLRTITPALLVASLVHAFWIVPSILVFGGGADGVAFGAVTDVDDWGWVFAENRLDRVATLTAHWGWPFAEYYPWSARLDGAPWIVLRWALPMATLLAPVVALRHRRMVAIGSLLAASLLVILSQGLAPPFEPLNRALYDHVPGWWLFRDPVSKFGPLLVVIYARSLGLVADRAVAIVEVWGHPRAAWQVSTWPDRLRIAGVATIVVGAVIHPWPMINGDVIPDDRGTLPPSHVELPDDWAAMAAVVGDAADGKVAVLPLNDYYQVTTTWGYHGVDIVHQVFDRPVVQRLPGGYFIERHGVDRLLDALSASATAGDGAGVRATLTSLGARHLIVRHDVAGFDATALDTAVASIDGLDEVHRSEIATVYEFVDGGMIRAETTLVAAGETSIPWALAEGLGTTVPPGTPADLLAVEAGGAGVPVNTTSGVAVPVFDEHSTVSVHLRQDGDELIGRLADDIDIAGVALEERDVMRIPLTGGTASHVTVGDQTFDLPAEGVVVDLSPGTRVVALARLEHRITSAGPLSNCHRTDDRTFDELGFSETRSGDEFTLTAREHRACIAFSLPGSDGPVAVEMTTERVAGAPAAYCLWSEVRGECVSAATVDGTGPQTLAFEAEQADPDEVLDLFVYADGTGEELTVSRYGPISAQSTRLAGQDTFLPTVALEPIDLPDDATATVDRPVANLIGEFGPVGDCNRYDERTAEEIGLSGEITTDGVTLRALDHTACSAAPIDAPAGSDLLVAFDTISPFDTLPRLCVWQVGLDACADAPALDPDTSSQRLVVPTDPAATALELYLYVDGSADGAEVRFEQIRVQVERQRHLLLRDPDAPTGSVVIADTTSGPGDHEVAVADAEGRFVLVLSENHAAGWQLEGLPDGWTAEHLEVDGYANGWIVTGTGDALLRLRYAPAALVRAAHLVSLTSFAMLLAGAALLAIRRRRLASTVGDMPSVG